MCNLTRSRLRQAYSLFAEVWKSIYSLTPVNVAGARNADIDSRQVFRQVHHHKLRSKGPFFKLPRSRSSPSPPDLKQAPGRPDSSRKYAQNGRVARRRPTSITTTRTKLSSPVLDWSTSYQAGSSRCISCKALSPIAIANHSVSSASHSGSDADTEEDDSSNSARGRAVRQSWGGLANGQVNKLASPTLRRRSPSRDPPPAMNGRVAFTRSRSPVVPSSSASVKKTSTWSPLVAFFSHRKLGRRTYILMPAVFELHVRLPLSSWTWKMSVNSRRAGECAILLGSLLYATTKISEITKADSPTIPLSQYNTWIITGTSLFLKICNSTILTLLQNSHIYFQPPCCIFYGHTVHYSKPRTSHQKIYHYCPLHRPKPFVLALPGPLTREIISVRALHLSQETPSSVSSG